MEEEKEERHQGQHAVGSWGLPPCIPRPSRCLKPKSPGLIARILIVVSDDTLVHELELWMVKEEEEKVGGEESGKVGFPEQGFKRLIKGAHGRGR